MGIPAKMSFSSCARKVLQTVPAKMSRGDTGTIVWPKARGERFRGPCENMLLCTQGTHMENEKIGIREFRENLAGYLESGRPLAITRHGETLGFYIPAQKRSRKAEIEAMRAAAKELDAMIAAWGTSEDELMREYKEIRRAGRERKRTSK